MFRFEKAQEIFDVGGVRLGGQPGELPTVMIGSIFFHGDKTVTDPVKGEFDKERALKLLTEDDEQSRRTGNPRMVDVNGLTPAALLRFIDFVADNTESPFLIDAVSTEARVAAIRHVAEVGLVGRCVFNSIGQDAKQEELVAIKEAGISSAILLLFNKRKPTIEGRMEMLQGAGSGKGLLEVAIEAGIKNLLVDVSIIDVPDPGPAAKACFLVKQKFGLPAGCGPHNAVQMWRQSGRLSRSEIDSPNAVAHTTPILMGANFVLYGPISYAPRIYLPCALADAYIAYCMRQQYGLRPLTKNHPLFRIF
ncbi:MAG: tetrahydromethanopterin S-methyltransferase subunit H [Candidatus Bathyarchaeia archaeon]